MQNTNRPTGMFGFTIVWLGQIVSVRATNMSVFALTIWIFEETGSATALGLMQVFFITPLRCRQMCRDASFPCAR